MWACGAATPCQAVPEAGHALGVDAARAVEGHDPKVEEAAVRRGELRCHPGEGRAGGEGSWSPACIQRWIELERL